jgi:simple sugar transport system ATP-binding protein/D-xylose transport system ATP-binding protein
VSNAAGADASTPLLEARGVRKFYGPVRAIDGVDVTIRHGEVVALVGDNGAGKSTLAKVLCGVHPPDDGEVLVEGEPVTFRSYHDAAALGIAVIYQDLALVDQRDVATNLFLGREPGTFFVNRRLMRREAARVIGDLNFNVPSVRTAAGQLSGGQRQAIAIARAVHQGGKLMIMDEPVAALGVEGQRKVLEIIRDLRARGSSVLVISHNLEHVFQVADRIVVLRRGKVAGVRERAKSTPNEIVGLIVGADAPLAAAGVAEEAPGGD